MKERKINIEFIRVFSIIMTIVIHVSNVYIYSFGNISHSDYLVAVIFNSLSRICVPLFFMVSGIFLISEKYDRKKYIKRIVRFIIILVVWNLIYYYFNDGWKFNGFFTAFINSFFNPNTTSRHLWFMYAIIGIYIALPFIQNMCKNMTREHENLFLILWMIISGGVVIYVPLARELLNTSVDVSYPVPIIGATYYLGYFVSGYILYNRFNGIKDKSRINKLNFWCVFTYICSTIVSILVMYFVSLGKNMVYDVTTWYRGIFVVLAAFSIFILVVINEDRFKNKFILKLSSLSFGVYLIHFLILFNIKEYINIIEYNPLIYIPYLTFLIYLLSVCSSYIIKKIPVIKNLI